MYENNSISIPYGAIKRAGCLPALLCSTISIPYGAIKRPVRYFQQLVKYISIPYGAIKSAFPLDFSIKRTYFNSLWCD